MYLLCTWFCWLTFLAFVTLTLAFTRCSYDAVGSLPGLVIVEGNAVLTVVAGSVVFTHTFPMDLPQGREKAIFTVIGNTDIDTQIFCTHFFYM